MLSVEAAQVRSTSVLDLTVPARVVGTLGIVVSVGSAYVVTTSCGRVVVVAFSLVLNVTVVVVEGSVIPKLMRPRVVTAEVTVALL